MAKTPEAEEPSIDELLRRYNLLRADLGHQPQLEWRGSRSGLLTCINVAKVKAEELLGIQIEAAEAEVEQVLADEEARPAKLKARFEEIKAEKKSKGVRNATLQPEKAARQMDKKLKAAKAKKDAGDTITLSELAEERSVEPKKARGLARKKADKLATHRSGEDGWVFKAKSKDAVIKILWG